MKLSQNLNKEIRNIFEREDYYGRPLSDIEVEEITNALLRFGEFIIDIVKNTERE